MAVNVPARARDKAHSTKETVQAKAEEVKQYVHEGAEALQAKAGDVALQAENLTHQAVGALSPPVATRVEALMATARQRPLPTAAIAVVVLLALRLVLRRLFRRNR